MVVVGLHPPNISWKYCRLNESKHDTTNRIRATNGWKYSYHLHRAEYRESERERVIGGLRKNGSMPVCTIHTLPQRLNLYIYQFFVAPVKKLNSYVKCWDIYMVASDRCLLVWALVHRTGRTHIRFYFTCGFKISRELDLCLYNVLSLVHARVIWKHCWCHAMWGCVLHVCVCAVQNFEHIN